MVDLCDGMGFCKRRVGGTDKPWVGDSAVDFAVGSVIAGEFERMVKMTPNEILKIERDGFLGKPPGTVAICQCCKEAIISGEEYANVNGENFHTECLADVSVSEILDLLDVPVRTAG